MENMNNEPAITINIANYTGEKPVEVIIRKGEAAKAADPIPAKEPIPLSFHGTIWAVSEWLSKRVSEIDQKQAHVEVDRKCRSITLVINERSAYNRGLISGAVTFNDEYFDFGINDTNHLWEPETLKNHILMNSSMFQDRVSAMNIARNLMNLDANARRELKKKKDTYISIDYAYNSDVKKLKSFWLNAEIIKGMEKVCGEVMIECYITDIGERKLLLVSPGFKKAEDEYADKCMEDEIEKIKETAPDIAILER